MSSVRGTSCGSTTPYCSELPTTSTRPTAAARRGGEHVRGPTDVDALDRVAGAPRLADVRAGREVVDRIGRARADVREQGVVIGDVDGIGTVHVELGHVVALGAEMSYEVAPDEATRSGDEGAHRQPASRAYRAESSAAA